MVDQTPVLYRETFSSSWRDVAPWLWRLVAVFLVAFVIVYLLPYYSDIISLSNADDLSSVLGVLAILLLVPAMSGTSIKQRGEIVVTKRGLTIKGEEGDCFFAKEDLTQIALQTLHRGRYRNNDFVLKEESTTTLEKMDQFWPFKNREAVRVLPYHLPFYGRTVSGVVVRVANTQMLPKTAVYPIFIPTKDPDGLSAALRKMSV